MNSKYRDKQRRNSFFMIIKMAVFIFLAYAAIILGITGGSLMYDVDARIVERIDVETFKDTLNNSFPLIYTIYNSGNISVSFENEIKGLIRAIFDFDLNKPLTILNSQSPILYSYYYKSYLPYIANKNSEERKISYETPDTININDLPPEIKEDASSIIYEGEEKKAPGNDVVYNGKIALQNETKFKIDQSYIEELLKAPLKITFDKKSSKILIYHTHTSESYLDNIKNINRKDIPSSSSDARYNVVRVGEELAQTLKKKYGIDVIHNGTVNDYNYNSSYNKSLNTVTTILKSYPSIKVALDIHRDGMGEDEPKLRAVTRVNGKDAAQVMFVVGTDQTLNHPNWRENFKFAVKLQEKLNEQCPGLAKPINISENRYNEHLTTGSLIIEIGGDGNTLDEALESTKYLAKAINDVINGK